MAANGGSSSANVNSGRQRLRPDRELLRRVLASGGEDLRRCMQCATCSTVCEIADARNPGPRKEMAWAQWGLRERLVGDVDLWLCHQCNDCSRRCPRGARPGDVMAALRRECVIHYSAPRAFGRWASSPRSLLWIALAAAAVLVATAAVWQQSGLAQAELSTVSQRTVFPFWARLPHGLLAGVFGLLVVVDLLVLLVGARRFWRDMSTAAAAAANGTPPAQRQSVAASWRAALKRIVWHDDFGLCASTPPRRAHHLLVVYGMVALALTDLWVVTARFNPLLDGLVYPLGFWNPWKIMANLGGVAVVLGCALMLRERWKRPETAGAGRYADWALLGILLLVAVTGFATEAVHYARLEPLRYGVYATHLVSVFALIWVLPYSKLAHVVYRTVAMVFAEHIGRRADKAGGSR